MYCVDLISFGLENDIPEAVRLGEKAMAETGESLSFEMAKAVKEYVLKNNQRYRESARSSGPLDLTSVYKKNKSMINVDDPYWQEYMRKNYRSQDRYKLPSAFAWDYKEHGLLGEIVDVKALQ